MINLVNWETAHLCGTAFAGQHRLRYRLFIERQHYDVPSYRGMEYDQFDTPAATYLVSPDPNGSGEARGIARLIPTSRPYMIKELWPELVEGEPLPCSDVIYEASRFGIDDRLPAAARERVSAEIVIGCQEFALLHGISHFLVVMPPLIIRRAIGGLGCDYRLLGAARQLGRHTVAAAAVAVSWRSLTEARQRADIAQSILTLPALPQIQAA
jgi:N-acyl-L-homoserine lactone synthetase